MTMKTKGTDGLEVTFRRPALDPARGEPEVVLHSNGEVEVEFHGYRYSEQKWCLVVERVAEMINDVKTLRDLQKSRDYSADDDD